MRYTSAALALIMSLLSGSVLAQSGGWSDDEAEARRVEQELVAPCCWRQQVAVHDSPIAREIRQEIRARLARGESRQQIITAYVQQYGNAILVEPPARGFNRALYALPPLLLAASGAALVLLVQRFTSQAEADPSGHMDGGRDEPPGRRTSVQTTTCVRWIDPGAGPRRREQQS